MTVFRTATLRTFFFAIHAGAKELKKLFARLPLQLRSGVKEFESYQICINSVRIKLKQYATKPSGNFSLILLKKLREIHKD